jgi:hemerythrin-like domain-containing protein
MNAAVSPIMQPTTHKPTKRASSADLRRLLREDHERLDRLFSELLAAFQADAREDAAHLWNDFDTGLRTHLELEESFIFPEFAKVQPEETTALEREHEHIRERLLQLGVGVDLHLTNDAQVDEFVRELRAHAAREDELLYQWAERELQPAAESHVRSWLKNVRKRAR